METLAVAKDLEIRVVPIIGLREQDVNAHYMPPKVFERLVANIKERGSLESLPYASQPGGEGPVQIVSGHHRVRAANAAGLTEVPVLVDTAPMTRSQTVAKQLAHNALVGADDPHVLRELIEQMDEPDDILASGVAEGLVPSAEDQSIALLTPHIDFDWRTFTVTFLPHQADQFGELLDSFDGPQDLVLVALPEQFEAFVRAAAGYARVKDVRAAGTAVAMLIDTALREIREFEESREE